MIGPPEETGSTLRSNPCSCLNCMDDPPPTALIIFAAAVVCPLLAWCSSYASSWGSGHFGCGFCIHKYKGLLFARSSSCSSSSASSASSSVDTKIFLANCSYLQQGPLSIPRHFACCLACDSEIYDECASGYPPEPFSSSPLAAPSSSFIVEKSPVSPMFRTTSLGHATPQ